MMADTITANLGLQLPQIFPGDQWGNKLNSNFAAIDVFAGGSTELTGARTFGTAAQVLADVALTYTPGTVLTVLPGQYVLTESEGFSYKVAASGASDQDATTAGGVKLYYESGGFVGKNGKKYQIVSCVLRQNTVGTGWYALDDAGHSPVGLDPVTPVSEVNGDIVLNYNFTGQKIGSLLVTPDEGYAHGNLSFGASVGNSEAAISLYHPFWARTSGTGAVSFSYFGPMASSSALTDGDWFAEYSLANGTWVFTHASESHSDATGSVVAVEGYGEDSSASTFAVTARSKTSFTVEARQQIHGRTNGATTVLSDNAGPFTASWNGTDTWTITHPASGDVNDVMVSCVSPQFVAGIQSANTTQFTLKFFDIATGAAYTSASVPANIYFMRGGAAACALTGSTKFKAERLGKCKVDAQYVSGASSNLWVFGVFEVA